MGSVLVPYFGYRDAAAAIDFLRRAFGFAVAQRYDGEDGSVMHAELHLDGAFIMLGSATAADQGGAKPVMGSGVYAPVADVDAHFATATAAGAAVVYGPEDTAFGTRRYRVRDPEGYEWTFGTYRPQPPA